MLMSRVVSPSVFLIFFIWQPLWGAVFEYNGGGNAPELAVSFGMCASAVQVAAVINYCQLVGQAHSI